MSKVVNMKNYYKSKVDSVDQLGGNLPIKGKESLITEEELNKILDDFFDVTEMENGDDAKERAINYLKSGTSIQLDGISISYK